MKEVKPNIEPPAYPPPISGSYVGGSRNVASLKLCQELYELSGWITGATGFCYFNGVVTYGHYEDTKGQQDICPAYDLGYLLRKLPPNLNGCNLTLGPDGIAYPKWCAYYDESPVRYKAYHEDTPEDAAAKLATELFKQGILK